MIDLPVEIPSEFLRPIVAGWMGKISSARKSRSSWSEMSDECRMFYNRSAAAMWDEGYARKFWKNAKAPQFRITLNLAFEYVAVYMPHLMWEVPHRKVTPKRPDEMPPQLFGGEQSPLFQMHQQERQQMQATDSAVAWLLEDRLNYTAREMPGGGLSAHGQLATLDALLTGRGCQIVRPYKMPGSRSQLTGCFHLSPERVLTDPDYSSVHDCKWMSVEHWDPHWEVERRFKLTPNSLKERSSIESLWSQGEGSGDSGMSMRRRAGQTNDMLQWFEIYSKTGIGARLTGMNQGIKQSLEKTVGDYAYIAVSPGVPYPLNCSSESLRNGATEQEVKAKFMWPLPLWTDNRWPVEFLDFYDNTDEQDPSAAWPIPPLAPAMGEIKFLNFIIPWLAQLIWNGSRDFWAVPQQHLNEIKQQLQEGEHYTCLGIPLGQDDISKVVQRIKQAEVRTDLWRIVEIVTDLFRRRTGMPDTVYGMNEGGTQSRTAEDAVSKRDASKGRMNMMQKRAVAFHGQLAASEACITRLFVKAEDVAPRLGQTGAMMWRQYVESGDVDTVFRQMNYTVSASSIRYPNRDRDVANFMQWAQFQIALIQQYAQQTGDYSVANELNRMFGELHDMEMDQLRFPDPDPQEAQQQQQMQQQQIELEQQKLASEIEKAKIELQGKMLDVEIKTQEANVDQAGAQLDLIQDQERHDQDIEQDSRKHVLDLLQSREKFTETMRQMRTKAALKPNQTNGR